MMGTVLERISPSARDASDPSGNPQLAALLAFWDSMRGGRAWPSRHDLGIEGFRPWFGHIAIVKVLDQPPPRFLIALAGIEINRIFGADHTGRYIEEVVPPEALATVLEPYEQCLAMGKPIFSRLSPGVLKGTFRHLDRLLLPCSDDGSRIDTVIAGVYVSAFDPERGSVFGRALPRH